MKILVILNDLDIGGAQNYTINLMNCFVSLGHEVFLRVLSNNVQLIDRIDKRIETQIWIRQNKIDISVIRKIRNEIKNEKYNLVISSYILYVKLASIFLKNKTKILYPIHSTVPRTKKDFYFNYIMFKLKKKNEVFLSSIDNQTDYLVKKYNLSKSFFHQIYNGVDTNRFNLAPVEFSRAVFLNKLNIPPNNEIILMVAGYRPEKRHLDAIEAFKILYSKNSNSHLVCVGDNREKERDLLKTYVENNNIKNILLLTAKEAGEVIKFYWVADIFTLTSNRVETFPISVLEALSCGVPCVLTDTGGAIDIIKEEKYGKVVPPNQPSEIAKAWDAVLKNNKKIDKKDIREYVVNNFSIEISAKNYLNIVIK